MEFRIEDKRTQILSAIAIILIYTLTFWATIEFDNEASFRGDEMYFQSIAVNFAKGHGFPKVGGLEKFEVYKFSFKNVSKPFPSVLLFENSAGPYSFSKHPVYPLFMGLVYKIFGINPWIIKWLQLLMLIITSAFLPWMGFRLWGKKGYYSGLVASPLFIFFNFYYARYLFAEPLIVFTLFLIVSGYIYFKRKENYLSGIMLGILLGISLLLKGTFIFIPILILGSLCIDYIKNKEKKIVINAIIIFLFIVMLIVPWSVYANIKNRENVKNAEISLEILTNNKLSKAYKAAFIDTSSLVYINPRIYPPFLASSRNMQEAIHSGKIPDEEIPLYFDNSTVEEKTVWQKFYLKSNKFILFSNQSPMLMIDGNCELYPNKVGIEGSGGGGNVGWGRNINCTYYHDKMEDEPIIIRVLNFYINNPGFILRNFVYKLYLGFFRMKFLWAIIYLLFIESLIWILKRYIFNKFLSRIYTVLNYVAICGVIYTVFIFNPPVPSKDSFIFYAIITVAGLISIIINVKNKVKNTSLKIPLIFKIIFINFILISVIIFGFERQNNVMNFFVTLTAIYYLIMFIENSMKEIKNIKNSI